MPVTTTRKAHLHAIAFDRGSARTIDAQGFLHVEGCNISKAVVNPYWGEEIPDCEQLGLDPQKVYYLFRDPKELEKAAATFNDLPLMDNHVEVGAEQLENDKVHGKIVGTTGSNARFEDPYLVNELVVWTAGGIQGVMSKEQTQLSCAYRYELDMTPGEYQGQKYDGRMFNLAGNHVALVDEGRAGPDVVVKDQKSKKPVIDMKNVAKLVADALAPVKKVIGMAYDCIPEIIEQLTAVKATIEAKLKPGVEGEDAKVLDDCTSTIDLAIHHLLDFQEDKDAKGTVVQEDETHGHYAGEYGTAAKHANTVGQAAGSKGGPSHTEAQAAHQKAAVAANKEGNAGKTSDHLRVAAAHSALHSDPGNVMAKGVLAGHYGAKDSVVSEDETYGHYAGEFGEGKGGNSASPHLQSAEAKAAAFQGTGPKGGRTPKDRQNLAKSYTPSEMGALYSRNAGQASAKALAASAGTKGEALSKAAHEATRAAHAAELKGNPTEAAKAHQAAFKAHSQAQFAQPFSYNPESVGTQHGHAAGGHQEAATHFGKAAKAAAKGSHDSVISSDSGLATDKIEHREGHKDSNGKPAPWIIVSESGGRVIWSGTSKEDAVRQLRNVEGHKAGARDSVIADIAEREDVSAKSGKTKYGEVKFADPKNKKYPIDTPDHVRSALSYWGRPANRSMYSEEDQTTITKRIDTAARRFKIGKYAESK